MNLFASINDEVNDSPVQVKCYNRQMTAKHRLSALKQKGWGIEITTQGAVLKQPSGRQVEAFKVNSLVKECFGDKCDLVMPSEDPLWTVSDLGNGKFLVKFNKEIF